MKKIRELFLRYVLLGYVVFSFVALPLTSHATITPLISYQAKLTDTNNVAVADASYTVKFRIFSASSGGSALYAEQQSVTTANGLFNALIGSGTLIESSGALSAVDFNQDPLYLGIQIGSDDEMTPRKRIASSVFAFNANKVGGKSETELALLAGRVGSQTLYGGTASGEYLALHSTSNATKGRIYFGSGSFFDDATERLGIGMMATGTPSSTLDIRGTEDIPQFRITANSTQSNSNPLIQVLTNTGSELFRLHSDGSSNIFLGASAGAVNDFGGGGTLNVFVGRNAGSANTTGSGNTGVGDSSLSSNTIGANNTAFGEASMGNTTTGSANIGLGKSALYSNLTGNENVAIGRDAGFSSLGSSNIFLGYQSGYNETGSNKLYISNSSTTSPLIYGDFSLGRIGFGTSTPSAALDVKGTADISQFIVRANGTQSNSNPIIQVLTNTGSELFRLHSDDSTNLFLGFSAGQVNDFGGGGQRNVFVGSESGAANTTGNLNSAVGRQALYNNTTGGNNTAVGDGSLWANTIGGGNTAMGESTLSGNVSGGNNTAVGKSALRFNNGAENVAMGNDSLFYNTTGGRNTAFGYQSGMLNATGTDNIFLGYQSGYNETGSNKLYISNSSTTSPLIYGDFSTGNVAMGVTSTPSTAITRLAIAGAGSSSSTFSLAIADANSSPLFSVRNDGRIGMGTSTPSAALDIKGTADISQFIVRANGTQSISNPMIQVLTNTGSELFRLHSDDSTNLFLGLNTGQVNNSGGGGTGGTFLGGLAGSSNTTGNSNTAIGGSALRSNTSGSSNTAIGVSALFSNLTTNSNTAIGTNSLYNNVGNANTAVGEGALYTNASGASDTAQGFQALYLNTTGTANTANGWRSLYSNAGGNYNIAYGAESGYLNSSGDNNVFLGTQAGYSALGSSNIFLGYQSGYNETGSNKLYISNSSTTSPLIYGDFSTGRVGFGTSTPSAALDIKGSSDIPQLIVRANGTQSNSNPIIQVLTNTGSELFRLHSNDPSNLFIGNVSGGVNTSGTLNTSLGWAALFSNTTGANNTALGVQSLHENLDGGSNVAVGVSSLWNNSSGNNNSALGVSSIWSNTTGSGNVAMGWESLYSNTIGSNNTSLGYLAGHSNVTGDNNVFLGYKAGYDETGSNKLYIANSSSTPLIYGDFLTGNISFGTTSTPTAFTIARSGGAGNTVSNLLTYGTNTSVYGASKARGTSASPTAVQSGDTLGVYGFNGYGSTGFASANTGRVGGVAEENWTDTSRGTALFFSVTPVGTSTISTAMKIDDNGSVGIGTLSPITPLSVVRSDGVSSGSISAITYASSLIGSDPNSAFVLAGARGTTSAPSAVQDGDDLGNLLFTGYGSTGFGTEGGAAVHGISTGAWTDTSQPAELRFLTTAAGTSTDAVRMVISEDGNVGIGTDTPTTALHVVRDGQEADAIVSGFGNGSNDYGALLLTRTRGSVATPSAVETGNTLGRLHFAGYDGTGFNQIGATIEAAPSENWNNTSHGSSLSFNTTPNASTTVATRMFVSNTGDVGIGTTGPTSRLDVYLATSTSAVNIFEISSDVSSTQNIVFRVDTDGNVFADGTFTPGGADLAENYIASDASLESGDIVSFSSQSLGVNKSGTPYDVKLLGIVSKKPGVLLGGGMENSVPLALSGRVPTKVSLKNGSIHIGDPITSSDIAGVGMKATKSGRIIGYALEDYNSAPSSEIKTILVFANLGYHLGDEVFGGGGTSSNGFSEMLTSTLSSFAGTIKATGTWMFDKIHATFLGAKYIQVESGVTMKDKITGDYYCLTLQNGEIAKAKGTCEELDAPVGGGGSTSSVPSEPSPETPTLSPEVSSTSPQTEQATTTTPVETPSPETADTTSSTTP